MTADPRGPVRTITAVEMRPDVALVTLSCDHVAHLNQTFTYKVGRDVHCFKCLKEAREAGENP